MSPGIRVGAVAGTDHAGNSTSFTSVLVVEADDEESEEPARAREERDHSLAIDDDDRGGVPVLFVFRQCLSAAGEG